MSQAEQRRRAYLDAMGIPVWQRRAAGGERRDEVAASDGVAVSEAARTADAPGSAAPAPAQPLVPMQIPAQSQIPTQTHLASATQASPFPQTGASASPAGGSAATGASDAIAALDWPALEARVAACTACELHRTRTQTVFGVGARDADWMIIGEAPGADEDRQGEPFVGRAGQLLNNMLFALGFQREQVYIANILKCRPPRNRDPQPEEVAQCEGYLARQVALVRPRLILAVGRIAAHNLLKTNTPLGKLRGHCHYYGEARVPVVVTYHPAYLLRSPQDKRKAWEDLQYARQVAAGVVGSTAEGHT